jgi:hypothetical protein
MGDAGKWRPAGSLHKNLPIFGRLHSPRCAVQDNSRHHGSASSSGIQYPKGYKFSELGPAIRRVRVFKKLLIRFVALGFLGLMGFAALAWRPAIAPITPPTPESFAPELVAKGEALSGSGFCAECHTTKGSRKAGALPWDLHERAFAGEFAPPRPYDPRAVL